jgi:uncharacterized membrane protein YphA (DoxX/SURF4 family)
LSERPAAHAFAGFTAPQPVERLAFVRLLAPLAILGFLSSRFVHVEHWLTNIGFVVPPRASADYRQPLYIPPIPLWLAFLVTIATVLSGLATTIGYRTRWASGIFAALLAYLALADRLEAFTINKLGTVVAIALFASPAGARFSLDAWLRWKREPDSPLPTHVTWGNVRFFQGLLVFMYLGSGLAKAAADPASGKSFGDWVSDPNTIWSHLHDSYQTAFTYFLATSVPAAAFTLFQYLTLAYELGAPLWFGVRRLRMVGLAFGLAMHASIGLMFGPVVWFSLLMMVLLFGSFAPLAWLRRPLEGVWAKVTEGGAGNSPSLSKAARG